MFDTKIDTELSESDRMDSISFDVLPGMMNFTSRSYAISSFRMAIR